MPFEQSPTGRPRLFEHVKVRRRFAMGTYPPWRRLMPASRLAKHRQQALIVGILLFCVITWYLPSSDSYAVPYPDWPTNWRKSPGIITSQDAQEPTSPAGVNNGVLEVFHVQFGLDDFLDDAVVEESQPLPWSKAPASGEEINVPTGALNYLEVFSMTTSHRRYAPVYFDGTGVTEPSIIPHPYEANMWIITARREQSLDDHMREEQLVCKANYYEDVFICADGFTVMPTAPSRYGICPFRHEDLNHQFGPNDLRLFYGPEVPYVIYNSQSRFTCMNNWLQDARTLLDDFHVESVVGSQLYHTPTEMQRPGKWADIERDYFLFWDTEGTPYVHANLWPRVYGRLEEDGSFHENLASLSAARDSVCVAKHLPHIEGRHESYRQGTNSLLITLCDRADDHCMPTDANTFIMHIFHTVKDYQDHPAYEPYVILFDKSPPFAIRAISERPLWIAGRKKLSGKSTALKWAGKNADEIPDGHTESFIITNLSWSKHGMKYHGYRDDPLWISLGIEGTGAGVMDVLASDLLGGLQFC